MSKRFLESYRAASKLKKFFVFYSALLLSAIAAVYVLNVAAAFAMDKQSYNCTSDSMMKQICADPFGSSISWTFMYVIIFGTPFLLIWAILGTVLYFKRPRHQNAR